MRLDPNHNHMAHISTSENDGSRMEKGMEPTHDTQNQTHWTNKLLAPKIRHRHEPATMLAHSQRQIPDQTPDTLPMRDGRNLSKPHRNGLHNEHDSKNPFTPGIPRSKEMRWPDQHTYQAQRIIMIHGHHTAAATKVNNNFARRRMGGGI